MPKIPSKGKASIQIRHNPLGNEINKPQGKLRESKSVKSKTYNDEYDDEFDEDIADQVNSKIMKEAKLQRLEVHRDSTVQFTSLISESKKTKSPNDNVDDYDVDTNDIYEDIEDDDDDDDLVAFDGDYVTEAANGLSEAEEATIQHFLSASRTESRTLADIIMEKIREKEMMAEETSSTHASVTANMSSLPPKVIEVYTAVGKLLQHYKSGKLPKALKMLPHLKNWEDVLWLTRPDQWSPGATFACTRIFSSNLNDKLAQRFYNMILLEKCRDDIRSNQKLNYHLYMALKKAVFKPAAFYKGIILPLAQSLSCTLREAIIFGSILSKVSIQGNHSAAALLRLIEMPYSGSTSLFVKILVNKKYALPRRVIDALVDHFYSFATETRVLPVLWHQALLVFAQRYKLELNENQKEKLKHLLKVQFHHLITPEIKREIYIRGEN